MRLNPEDKKRIRSFYKRRLKKYGSKGAMSLDWDSYESQQGRFEILSKIGDLNSKKVLDFGSGLGDLYGYLDKHFKNVDYLGIDILPDFVKAASKKFPKAKFSEKGLTDLQESFDYVFASGSLTFQVQGGKNFYFKIIEEMYQHAKIGVAFNMLNDNFYDSDGFYVTYNPLEVLEFCKTFAKDVKIIFEYLKGDFTIYLFKHKNGTTSIKN
ncbi:MAG: class I SAM-dependent methyltransferase [Candidatus Doudnabacteria bacterium]